MYASFIVRLSILTHAVNTLHLSSLKKLRKKKKNYHRLHAFLFLPESNTASLSKRISNNSKDASAHLSRG